jgi:hypothetical protein
MQFSVVLKGKHQNPCSLFDLLHHPFFTQRLDLFFVWRGRLFDAGVLFLEEEEDGVGR